MNTGDEHLWTSIGIIHMNAHLRSPCRFLQADSIWDSGTQGMNRYSYVLNNPLTLTDPSGHRSQGLRTFIGIVITAVTAYISKGLGVVNGGALVAGGGALAGAIQGGRDGALWGAFSATLFCSIDSAFQNVPGSDSVATPGGVGKLLAHATAGGVMNELQGGKSAGEEKQGANAGIDGRSVDMLSKQVRRNFPKARRQARCAVEAFCVAQGGCASGESGVDFEAVEFRFFQEVVRSRAVSGFRRAYGRSC